MSNKKEQNFFLLIAIENITLGLILGAAITKFPDILLTSLWFMAIPIYALSIILCLSVLYVDYLVLHLGLTAVIQKWSKEKPKDA